MSDTAETMATAFEAEAGTAPVVNVSDVDASTVITSTEKVNARQPKFYTEDDLAKVRSRFPYCAISARSCEPRLSSL